MPSGYDEMTDRAYADYAGGAADERARRGILRQAMEAQDFKVNPKYTVRLSLSGFNLTDHFNALAVHANVADPQSGIFFGNYHRRYRFDFEVVF